jgi:beta-glucosidase
MFQAHFADTKPHNLRVEYTHRAPLFAAGVTFNWQPPAEVLRDEAVKAAGQADVVVAFVGLSPELEGEEMPIHVEGFSGGDRTDIGLPRVQQELLEALAATGKPLVVVLLNGSALAVNWAEQNAAAILEAWYPGEQGGAAIAETLSGANNPAGRLPVTFYASLDQLPPFDDYSMKNRTYRYFTGHPLYGFGYGLSYASFAYSNLKLSSTEVKAGQALSVEANVKNTSAVAGDEVAELYVTVPEGSQFQNAALLRELRGFQRIHLSPGETRRVAFTLTPRDLSQVTTNGEHKVMPGPFSVVVSGGLPGAGSSSVETTFEITGEADVPR